MAMTPMPSDTYEGDIYVGTLIAWTAVADHLWPGLETCALEHQYA